MSNKEIEIAITKLLEWIGDDPTREGLKDTPQRIISRYKKLFSGYKEDLDLLLSSADMIHEPSSGFENQVVSFKDIEFISFCEHHMLPMIGTVDISYIVRDKLIGIGQLVRIVDAFAKRLQLQERLTRQIADALQKCLNPTGIAVYICARHYCVDSQIAGSNSTIIHTHCKLGSLNQ